MKKQYISEKTKSLVKDRANNCCEYCQSLDDYGTTNFSIDHIKPLSLGGNNKLENLAFSCLGCNWAKSDKTHGIDPSTQKEVPLYSPRVHNWLSHFSWSKDFTRIIGLSPIGRTTVETLHLNRQKLQNRRRLFFKVSLHPPTHTQKR